MLIPTSMVVPLLNGFKIMASLSKAAACGKPRAMPKPTPWSSHENFCRLYPNSYRHTLVRQLQNYVISLYKQGRWKAVCDIEVEAVELARELYRLHPGRYRHDLERQPQDYITILLDSGRSQAAP
jgi:hypothetical protein